MKTKGKNPPEWSVFHCFFKPLGIGKHKCCSELPGFTFTCNLRMVVSPDNGDTPPRAVPCIPWSTSAGFWRGLPVISTSGVLDLWSGNQAPSTETKTASLSNVRVIERQATRKNLYTHWTLGRPIGLQSASPISPQMRTPSAQHNLGLAVCFAVRRADL